MNQTSIPSPESVESESRKLTYWEKSGGGSLMISLILHGVLVVAAIFWLVRTALYQPEAEAVEFLPGGGGGAEGDRPRDANRRQMMAKTLPAVRLTSFVASANNIVIPDTSQTFNAPSLSLYQRGMSGNSSGSGSGVGGGIGSGIGRGIGSGTGPGAGAGFVGGLFGAMGGTGGGMPGILYDMKQDARRNPVAYNGGVEEFFPRLYKAADDRFRKSAFRDFYRARTTLTYTLLAVPNAAAEEGPKAFQAEKEIQPRGWFIHYRGRVDPPQEGLWRFAGIFDDALLVYVNHKLVFDGSYDTTSPEEVRAPFGNAVFAGSDRRPFAGKWVSLKRGTLIDIVIGERPGGRVGGVLLVQRQGQKYAERERDVPVLPVFSFMTPRKEDRARIDQMGFPIAEDTPVFKISQDKFLTAPEDRDAE